jgi:hypothetical protein
MQLREIASATRTRIATAVDGIKRFAKLERVLAAVCLFIPVFLISFDDGPIRDSISAYYNMQKDQMFYFPLTVASMLFIVNGVVKERHVYNSLLGVMLAGVILFNYEDTKLLHFTFAIGFFGGNAVVILLYSSRKERWFKAILVALISLSMLGCFVFGWFTLFWAEWVSLAIISLHYILESWGVID